MENTSAAAATSDGLRRTQQYLAEVIDECVFVERQRELTERRLSSQLESQRTLIEDLFSVLRDVCRYMSTMEDAILPTLLSTIPATRSEHRQLVQLRSAIRDTIMRLRQDNGAHREDDMLLPTIQHISSGSREGNVPIVSLDRAAKAGAEVMQRLFEGEARLVDALTRATARVEATHAATATENSELTALRARMDELSCLVRSGNAGLLKTASGPSAPLGLMTAAAAAQEDTSPAATRFAEARVIAYEKTVQALNNELALLHENYAALSRARACDIETLKRHMTDAQRKHEDQITECDAVLNRISLELEQLIQENAQLRCKLQRIAQPE